MIISVCHYYNFLICSCAHRELFIVANEGQFKIRYAAERCRGIKVHEFVLLMCGFKVVGIGVRGVAIGKPRLLIVESDISFLLFSCDAAFCA